MQTILTQMLAQYGTNTLEEKKNVLNEIVQEIALCGLSRAGFFKHAAFYGGTDIPETLTLNCGDEVIKIEDIQPSNQMRFIMLY